MIDDRRNRTITVPVRPAVVIRIVTPKRSLTRDRNPPVLELHDGEVQTPAAGSSRVRGRQGEPQVRSQHENLASKKSWVA